MVKYSGEFVVEDVRNGVKYLVDLMYGWDIGDPLTEWVLGGNTPPTIASDGQLDFYDNTNAANQTSAAYRQIVNTLGKSSLVLRALFTRMADDTSQDENSLIFGLSPTIATRGRIFLKHGALDDMFLSYINQNNLGYNITSPFPIIRGRAYEYAVLADGRDVIWIVDGVRIGSVAIGVRGAAPLSLTPLRDFIANNKYIYTQTRHDAGEVSHYRLRDVKIGQLAGVSAW